MVTASLPKTVPQEAAVSMAVASLPRHTQGSGTFRKRLLVGLRTNEIFFPTVTIPNLTMAIEFEHPEFEKGCHGCPRKEILF